MLIIERLLIYFKIDGLYILLPSVVCMSPLKSFRRRSSKKLDLPDPASPASTKWYIGTEPSESNTSSSACYKIRGCKFNGEMGVFLKEDRNYTLMSVRNFTYGSITSLQSQCTWNIFVGKAESRRLKDEVNKLTLLGVTDKFISDFKSEIWNGMRTFYHSKFNSSHVHEYLKHGFTFISDGTYDQL